MKQALGLLVVLAGLTAAACAADPAPGAAPEPAATTAAPGHDELAPGWDESPDGPSPTPDAALDDAALAALLRTRAGATGADHCTPDQVAVTLEGFDQSIGHRYSRVVVRNTDDAPCVVEGVPGLGARGAWGTTFVNEVEPGISDSPSAPVRLSPGDRATSDLEWTGDLAGAESEHVSLLVLQLARGQVPVAVPARISGDTPRAPTLDIGPLTTVRLSPFRAAG